MENITYDTFKQLDIRVGTILSVEPIVDSDKLLRCMVDTGDAQPRQIVSGIRTFYPDYERLVGRQLLYVVNLEPRTIRGVTSYGMLLAVDGKEGNPVFLVPDQAVLPGSKIR